MIVATVVAAYFFLGSSSGRSTAVDGQWATLFLANFHFAASSTNYLASLKPPSPLQNFWSLAVEEQFYIVYPGLFLLAARITSRSSLRIRLACALVIVGVASLALSVSTTATDPAGAFFSPFTAPGSLPSVGSSPCPARASCESPGSSPESPRGSGWR